MKANRPPRVLITRSPHQASELAERLRALGVEPILIPAIEIAEPASFAALDAALAQLDTFDWLLFTSANAVEALHHRLESKKIRVPPLRDGSIVAKVGGVPYLSTWRRGSASPRIAAIGPSTARALEALGLAPDLIPPQAVAESFAEALLPFVRQPGGQGGGSPTRFLLVRAESAGDTPPREHLPEALRAAGAEVTLAPAYRTTIAAESIPAIRALFAPQNQASEALESRVAHPLTALSSKGGVLSPQPSQISLDAITFTSSSTVHNLLALCEAAGVALPPEPLRISIGPITSQALLEAGLPPHAESPQATVAALAEAVARALDRGPVRARSGSPSA